MTYSGSFSISGTVKSSSTAPSPSRSASEIGTSSTVAASSSGSPKNAPNVASTNWMSDGSDRTSVTPELVGQPRCQGQLL